MVDVVLGIDPGITHCGAAIVTLDDRRPGVAGAHYWHPKPTRRRGKTLDCRDRISRLMIEVHRVASLYSPSLIAAECFQSFGEQVGWETTQTLRLLGRLEGYAQAIEVPYLEITTQSVKAKIGAGQSASKGDVQRMVHMLTGWDPANCETEKEAETIADAIAVGIAARQLREEAA